MEHTQILKALQGHPLLVRLSEEQLLRLAQIGELEVFEPGETIVDERSLGDAVYLIMSGYAEVHKQGAGGRALATLAAGEFFGEMSLVEPAARSASVVARDPVRVFRLPNHALHRMGEEDPRAMNLILVAVVRTLSERLRRMNDTLATVGQLSDWLAGSLL
jgi:CRP-like cAMP-binding protein